MKRWQVLAIACAVLAVLAACRVSVGTPTPAPTLPVPTLTNTPPLLVHSVGMVYVRNPVGYITGRVLVPGEPVIVYGVTGDWCWIDAARIQKVWCGCVGIGGKQCKER